MPVAQRLDWGHKHCHPILLGEALTKIHKVCLSIPPAQNTYSGAPSLPYPTNPLTLRSPKPNYGQLTSKGHTWGCFLHPPFWAHGQVTPRSKKIGGCNFGKPHLGHHGVTCPFFSFGLPSISGPPGPPSHYRYPTYRPQTHLSWGKP